MVDCDKTSNGCHGGRMDRAFKYIKGNPLTTERSYPYKGRQGSCQRVSDTPGKIKGFNYVSKSSSQLRSALKKAPVTVGLAAGSRAFSGYTGGVITKGCDGNGNHAVLAVGYGTDSKYGDYFLIRNSWGARWGEDGYVRISMHNNTCKMLDFLTQPY